MRVTVHVCRRRSVLKPGEDFSGIPEAAAVWARGGGDKDPDTVRDDFKRAIDSIVNRFRPGTSTSLAAHVLEEMGLQDDVARENAAQWWEDYGARAPEVGGCPQRPETDVSWPPTVFDEVRATRVTDAAIASEAPTTGPAAAAAEIPELVLNPNQPAPALSDNPAIAAAQKRALSGSLVTKGCRPGQPIVPNAFYIIMDLAEQGEVETGPLFIAMIRTGRGKTGLFLDGKDSDPTVNLTWWEPVRKESKGKGKRTAATKRQWRREAGEMEKNWYQNQATEIPPKAKLRYKPGEAEETPYPTSRVGPKVDFTKTWHLTEQSQKIYAEVLRSVGDTYMQPMWGDSDE